MTDRPEGDVSAWLRATAPLIDGQDQRTELQTAASMFGPVAKWGRVEFPLPEYRAVAHGRDELAAVVKAAVFDSDGSTWLNIADAILAAGWVHQ